MNRYLPVYVFILITTNAIAQSTYTAADFATSGDSFYLTKAQLGTFNFDTTGANITWNYTALTGFSQRKLAFRLPTETGYTFVQWPYLYTTSNVNLSSTDGQTTAILGLQQSNPNDYYLKNDSYLREKASTYTLSLDGFSFNVKNVYTDADTIYKFPFTYHSINASKAAYTTVIPPDIYYMNVQLSRKDTVNGWGKLITPYGTFANCLKYVSTVTRIDSISVYGTPATQNDTTIYREIKWVDPSKKFQLLFVVQNKIGGSFITQSVEYFDKQQLYTPTALFAFLPLAPNIHDTVSFQNLTTSGYAYQWNFDDPSSGTSDSAILINPQHIFDNAGTYNVRLIAYNGTLSDTFSLPVVVTPKNITYTFTGNGNWSDSTNWSNHAVPPATLPATNAIIINPVSGGQCTLDVIQHIASGASLTVNTGKNLLLRGSLIIQ